MTMFDPNSEASLAEQVAALPEDERALFFSDFSEDMMESLQYDADFWLRPKQRIPDGDWYISALVAGRGFGKGIQLSTPIPTVEGWKTMGEIQSGDMVFDESGVPRQVVIAHDPYMPKKMYRIEFSDGSSILADGDHLWTTWTKAAHRRYYTEQRYQAKVDGAEFQYQPFPEDWPLWRTKAVKTRNRELPDAEWVQLVEDYHGGVSDRVLAERHGISRNFIRKYIANPEKVLEYVGASTKDTDTLFETQGDRHLIPFAKPIQFPEKDLPIEPWTFGILLGDGHTLTGQNIATHPDDKVWLMRKLEERGNDVAWDSHTSYDGKCAVLNTGKPWKELGLDRGKFVPEEYLTASVNQRLELLRGLMDSDGTVSKSGRYSFVNTNQSLSEAVAYLVRSLGMRAYTYHYAGRSGERYKTTCRDQYIVDFTSPDLVCVSSPRKVARHRPGNLARNCSHEILSVVEVAPEEVRCLTVDSPNRLFVLGKNFAVTHNTRAMSEWVRRKAMENPGCRIAIAARTSADVRNTVVTGDSGVLAVHPPSERPEYKPSTTSLHWPNGSSALLLSSESPDSARGPAFGFAVGDEFAAWKTTVDSSGATLYSNLLAATRLGDNPQLLLATTPKRTQVMRDLMELAKDPEERITIITGSTFDNKMLSSKYIANLTRRYGNSDLAKQELHGQMLGDAEGLIFTTEMINNAKDWPYQRYPLRVISVDPSVSADPGNRDECGIMAIGATAERDLTRRSACVIEDYTINASPDIWAKRVADAAYEQQTKFVVVEKNQGGALLQMAINAVDPTLKVFPVVATQGKRMRSEPVVIAMQQGRVGLSQDFPLLEDQMLFYDPDQPGSPDRLDAMVWGVISTIISPPPGLRPYRTSTTSAVGRKLPSMRGQRTASGIGRNRGSGRQHTRF